MTNDELRTHAKPLPIIRRVDCPHFCRLVLVEKCEKCEYCACCSPLSDYVQCGFEHYWIEKHRKKGDK